MLKKGKLVGLVLVLGVPFFRITIDANNLKTVRSRDNVLQMLNEAAEIEVREGCGVYYLNKNKATQLFGPERVPGRVHSLEGGYMHSVADDASPVKGRVKSQTDTLQFRKWFKGSKIVNEDGTPILMYHGTPYGTFNTFHDWSYTSLHLCVNIYCFY